MHTFEIIDGYIHNGTVNDYMSVSYEDGSSVASLSYKDYEVHYVLDHYWNNRFVLHLRHKETDGRWTEVTLKKRYQLSPHPFHLESILFYALRDNIEQELDYRMRIFSSRSEHFLNLGEELEHDLLKTVILAIIEETNDQFQFTISHAIIKTRFHIYMFHSNSSEIEAIMSKVHKRLNNRIQNILHTQ